MTERDRPLNSGDGCAMIIGLMVIGLTVTFFIDRLETKVDALQKAVAACPCSGQEKK